MTKQKVKEKECPNCRCLYREKALRFKRCVVCGAKLIEKT